MIGIFDSGFGGLTVMREIIRELPSEDIIYFGDTAHLPYGTKSRRNVQRYSGQILSFLMKKKVRLVAVACHTASSYALSYLQKRSRVPVLGMIQPGVEGVLGRKDAGRVGIIGTPGTIKARAYEKALKKAGRGIRVISQACPLFVPLVEEGWIRHQITKKVAEIYLKKMGRKIDALILGCTHYPLLKNVIGRTLGKKVMLIDPAAVTARLIRDKYPSEEKKKPVYRFYVSDDPEKFRRLGKKFLGRKIESVSLSRCTG